VFFLCCFAMSSYGRRFERRLNRHRTGWGGARDCP
jgi:general L-amino acid transport system permease protein